MAAGRVHTEKGDIHAEHVVNAAGLWAREVGAMAGVYHPLLPMAHQYLVTDDIPEIHTSAGRSIPACHRPGRRKLSAAGGARAVHRVLRAEMRTLGGGRHPVGVRPRASERPIRQDRGQVAFAYARFPVLERAGVKRVIHGPFTFAPDGNPLVGPVPGLRNYWAACAVMAGFSQGGGVGLTLAQWMVEGEPERDVCPGCRALRALDDAGLHRAEGDRELSEALLGQLSERGTARRAAVPHHADV
jgi:dimethylglycine dehydrogenase